MTDELLNMSPQERHELMVEFLTEANAHLQTLNEKLLVAEEMLKEGVDVPDEDLNAMFRAAHTIKGSASFLNLSKIEKLTHELETLLTRVKNRQLSLTGEIADVLFGTFDCLAGLFLSLKKSQKEEGDIESSMQKIGMILEAHPDAHATSSQTTQQPATPQGGTNERYLEAFLSETEQNIDDLNNLLMKLEKHEAEPGILNDIFRIVHTIKGSAGIVNAAGIIEVAHHMEIIFSYCREHHILVLDAETVGLLFRGNDAIREMTMSLRLRQPDKTDVASLCSTLKKRFQVLVSGMVILQAGRSSGASPVTANIDADISEFVASNKKVFRGSLAKGQDVFKVFVTIDQDISDKSMKLFLIEERLKKIGRIMMTRPSVEELDAVKTGAARVGFVFCSESSEPEIQKALSIDGIKVGSVERLRDKGGNAMEEPIKAASDTAGDDKLSPIEISTIRVDSRKLDHLMNLSGELVIVRAQFARLVSLFGDDLALHKELVYSVDDRSADDPRLKELKSALNNVANRVHVLDETTGALGKIASDIQSGVMQARMIPIEGVFTRFKRIVRDIAKEIGKDVDLQIEGEETELDKKLVDALGDPLTHMIRNAIDHGIEDRKTRLSLNKPERGVVSMKAYHRGNNICIEVGDDGRGMDPEKLLQAALKKGLVSKEQAPTLSERDKYNLVFLPGFSSAEEVTRLSGRGVGMDVVKNVISSFNGSVDIDTQLGSGTVFTLKIPLTLAIIQALLVVVGEEVYAISIESIREIIKIGAQDMYSIDGNITVKLRDHALSLVELERVIGVKGRDRQADKNKKIVVIADGEDRLGIIVDSLIGEDEIVIKSLTEHFAGVRGITGASILADGRVALILDSVAVIHMAK